jgi:hypothetical protein
MDKIIQCDVEYQYPIVLMEESETCKAIQQQGANKGKQCWRHPSESSDIIKSYRFYEWNLL